MLKNLKTLIIQEKKHCRMRNSIPAKQWDENLQFLKQLRKRLQSYQFVAILLLNC